MMKIVGHRGARGLAPENTWAALKKGIEAGVDEVEIDVRVTQDGVPVLNHDLRLLDASGRLRVHSYSWKELRARQPGLISLDGALDLIDAKCPVLIEVKPGEPVAPIVAVLNKFLKSKKYSPGDLLLGSKSQKTLLELHRALPKLTTVVIEPFWSVRAQYRAKQLGTKRLSMNQLFVWSGFVRFMHRRGYELYVYTLNDPRRAAFWQKHGLAGVITDFPDRFRK
jgi:glycerophosphoryl diester phosphodiesterase